MIEELSIAKDYRDETLFLAVNLMDRYLSQKLRQRCQLPCLVTLAVTSLLLAVKIEEPKVPPITKT